MFRNYDALLTVVLSECENYRYQNLRESTILGASSETKIRLSVSRRRAATARKERRRGRNTRRSLLNSHRPSLKPCKTRAIPALRVCIRNEGARVGVRGVKVGGTKRCFPQGHPGRSRLTLASKRLRVPIKVTLCLA